MPFRLGGRLGWISEAAYVLAGILFLAFCGWKFTLGIGHVLDLRLGDETKYLSYAIGADSPDDPAAWSPLYVAFYRFEHLFFSDPIRLYFFHQKLIAALLPISLFVYFASRRVPLAIAAAAATYLMISAANLPVEPKTMHHALAVMFLVLAIFVRLGEHPGRWGLMLAAAALLSLIRPEYAIAVPGFLLYGLYLVFAVRARDRELLSCLAVAAIFTAWLYVHYGFPMAGGRTIFAFAQHFALNYSAWHHLGPDPWQSDYRAIYSAVFHDAPSILAAALANPFAFIHHLASNLLHSPLAVTGLFFAHFNLILPRFEIYTLMEAGLLLAAAILALVYFARAGGSSRSSAQATPGILETLRSLPETICLAIFLLPFALMMLILYPRNHYVLGFGTVLFALAVVTLGRRIGDSLTPSRSLGIFAVLVVMVPSLGAVGVRIDRPMGELSAVPRPALQTAYFLRGLEIRSVVQVCAWHTPGPGTYAGANFRSISALDKHQGLIQFLASNDIGVIVADDRLRRNPAFYQDPAWRDFQSMPEKFGFAAHPLPESGGIVVYVRRDLAGLAQR